MIFVPDTRRSPSPAPGFLLPLLMLLVVVAVLSALAPSPAAAAAPGAPLSAADTAPPTAPRGFSVVRDPEAPLDLLLSWRPPADDSAVVRYDVSVVVDGVAHVEVVPAGQHSLRVVGEPDSARTTYRVRVGSRDAAGEGADAGWVIVWPAAPSPPSALTGGRQQGDATVVRASWSAPTRLGQAPVLGYRATLVRLKDRSRRTVETSDTAVEFADVAWADTHVLKVWALTAVGESREARLMIGNDQPGRPGRFVAVRDPADPTVVRLAWDAPTYLGIGPVTGYQLGWRRKGGRLRWQETLPADALGAEAVQHVADARFWTVRALNGRRWSYRVADLHVRKVGEALADVEPSRALPVVVRAEGRQVRVELDRNVPASADLVTVRVEPQAGATFRDTVTFPRDSREVRMGELPDGLYLVQVTATTPAGVRALASSYVRIGDVGALDARDWEVVEGRAQLSGEAVEIRQDGEVRVLDTRDRSSSDATLTTTATLHEGQGWGIWVRATHHGDGSVSGWSAQLDPGLGDRLALRLYQRGTECADPVVSVPFPAGFEAYAPHQVAVSVRGDTLTWSMDGSVVLTVPSLAGAVADSTCSGMTVPAGTRVGIRSWGTSRSTFVGTTLSD